MVSNQILQSTLDGLSSISGVQYCVFDGEGLKLACTQEGLLEKYSVAASQFIASGDDTAELNGSRFYKIYDEGQLEYVLISLGGNGLTDVMGKACAFQLEKLLVAYRERFDKDNFIKNLLLDNLLLIDIYNRSKKLHIDVAVRRIVFIVEMEAEKRGSEVDIVRALFADRLNDFVTAVDEKNVIVVRQLDENENLEDMYKVAKAMCDNLRAGKNGHVRVSFGSVVGDLKEVSRSYKEAKLALDVGAIFFEDTSVVAYSSLGIGRLIYQLPVPLCKMFIKEIFRDKSPDDFDDETLLTINKFFENSLNVSETSRQLYIHRNTLVYRLDKLEKSTGLDIRTFEDAITLKIALMVVKYMKYMENNSF